MPTISATDPCLDWVGAISLETTADWTKPWRIPYRDRDLYSSGDDDLDDRAAMASGVQLRFDTNAEELQISCEPLPLNGCFDLCIDGKSTITTSYSAGDTTLRFADLPAGDKTVEIWLSQAMPIAIRHIETPAGSTITKTEKSRLKWVTYGSSITHCRTAGSPTKTWPSIVARARDFELTSLGFGGQCHADPLIARLIRDLPADFISIKIGINIYSQASLGPRAFRPAILGTIATIRDGHPETPLVVCSPIWGHDRETTPNTAGMTLAQMRDEVKEAVISYQKRSDENIYYLDGLKLFDASLAEYLPDNLHPNDRGNEIIAENFLREVFAIEGVDPG